MVPPSAKGWMLVHVQLLTSVVMFYRSLPSCNSVDADADTDADWSADWSTHFKQAKMMNRRVKYKRTYGLYSTLKFADQ